MVTDYRDGWPRRAACAGREDLHWHWDVANDEMLELCDSCEVRVHCLMAALEHRPEHDVGIWGGTTPAQREDIRRGLAEPGDIWRARGRPYRAREAFNA